MNKSDTLLLARLMKRLVIDSDTGSLTDHFLELNTVETKNLCVKVNPEFVEVIETYASHLGSTKSQFIRDALVSYMNRIDEIESEYLGDYLDDLGASNA